MYSLFFFLFGTLIGSFLNVCIYRIPKGESVVFPGSHCPNCKRKIPFYELVPIWSWIVLRGRCSGCKEKISFRYVLVEIVTGALFMGLYVKYGVGLLFFKYSIFVSFLMVIGYIDFYTTEIYTTTTWSAIGIGILFIIIEFLEKGSIGTYLLGAFLGGGTILFINLLTRMTIKKEGMGGGDVELCLLCGLYLGGKGAVGMLFFSFIIGAFIGGGLMAIKRIKRNQYVPFGPFIVLSAFLMLFYGEKIFQWYFHRIGLQSLLLEVLIFFI